MKMREQWDERYVGPDHIYRQKDKMIFNKISQLFSQGEYAKLPEQVKTAILNGVLRANLNSIKISDDEKQVNGDSKMFEQELKSYIENFLQEVKDNAVSRLSRTDKNRELPSNIEEHMVGKNFNQILASEHFYALLPKGSLELYYYAEETVDKNSPKYNQYSKDNRMLEINSNAQKCIDGLLQGGMQLKGELINQLKPMVREKKPLSELYTNIAAEIALENLSFQEEQINLPMNAIPNAIDRTKPTSEMKDDPNFKLAYANAEHYINKELKGVAVTEEQKAQLCRSLANQIVSDNAFGILGTSTKQDGTKGPGLKAVDHGAIIRYGSQLVNATLRTVGGAERQKQS